MPPAAYGPNKTLNNRWKRWSGQGIFAQVMIGLAAKHGERKTVKYDKRHYERRNRIEIMFVRLKGWPRVASRYVGCPKLFLSARALAASVIYWL